MFDTIEPQPSDALSGLDVEVWRHAATAATPTSRPRGGFPKAHVIEIDVDGQGIGHAGDFEAGDMPYAEAGSWVKRRIEVGVARPVIYFQVSAWRPVMESLAAAGVQRHHVRLWTAHYNGRPHLCSEACNFG